MTRNESSFRPLDFIRTVCEDKSLGDSIEVAVLASMAMGADNQTFKVRRSLTALGAAAKCNRGTVSDVVGRPRVARYLARVERRPRRVDIWLRQQPEPLAGQTDNHELGADVDGTSNRCRSGQHDLPVGPAPSAPPLPPSASSSPDPTADEERNREAPVVSPDDAPPFGDEEERASALANGIVVRPEPDLTAKQWETRRRSHERMLEEENYPEWA